MDFTKATPSDNSCLRICPASAARDTPWSKIILSRNARGTCAHDTSICFGLVCGSLSGRSPMTRLFVPSRAWHLVVLCYVLVRDATCNESVRIVFGSCDRQNLDQSIWSAIGRESADAFVWTGDAVYALNNTFAGLQAAFELQKANEQYAGAIEHIPLVSGVWDDHDFGVNDGGMHITQKKERQDLYLDFLNEPRGSDLRSQDGMYRAVDIKTSSSVIKLLLLDTRTHRENHIIPSIGMFIFPFSAVIAALTRLLSSVSGITTLHKADVLGEPQWDWLDQQLRNSDAAAHVIVSSIQLATTNPLVESWGHFPHAKQRLMRLLQQHNPEGLIFVSGDVHHAEFSEISFRNSDGSEGRWIEMTSSGLTHSCSEGWILGWTCKIMLNTFNAHRQQPSSFYVLRNYGVLELEFEDDRNAIEPRGAVVEARMTIKGIHGESVLSTRQAFDKRSAASSIDKVFVRPLPALPLQVMVALAAAVIVPAVLFQIISRSTS